MWTTVVDLASAVSPLAVPLQRKPARQRRDLLLRMMLICGMHRGMMKACHTSVCAGSDTMKLRKN